MNLQSLQAMRNQPAGPPTFTAPPLWIRLLKSPWEGDVKQALDQAYRSFDTQALAVANLFIQHQLPMIGRNNMRIVEAIRNRLIKEAGADILINPLPNVGTYMIGQTIQVGQPTPYGGFFAEIPTFDQVSVASPNLAFAFDPKPVLGMSQQDIDDLFKDDISPGNSNFDSEFEKLMREMAQNDAATRSGGSSPPPKKQGGGLDITGKDIASMFGAAASATQAIATSAIKAGQATPTTQQALTEAQLKAARDAMAKKALEAQQKSLEVRKTSWSAYLPYILVGVGVVGLSIALLYAFYKREK